MRCRTLETITIVAAFAASSLGLLGCKEKRPNEVPVYSVKGRFTYKGEPVSHAIVVFYPVGGVSANNPKARTWTNANGEYELTTYEFNDGAAEGDYEISLCWPITPLQPGELEPDKPTDRLDYKYYNPRKSKLKATIRPEPNVIDFNLP